MESEIECMVDLGLTDSALTSMELLGRSHTKQNHSR